jgi:hypothetical protein
VLDDLNHRTGTSNEFIGDWIYETQVIRSDSGSDGYVMGSNSDADDGFSESRASGQRKAILLRKDDKRFERRESGMHASQRRQGDGFLLHWKGRSLLLWRKGREGVHEGRQVLRRLLQRGIRDRQDCLLLRPQSG